MELSSPIDTIKKSFEIFFKKENLEYFIKISLVSLFLNVFYLVPNYLRMFGMEPTTEEMESFFRNPLLTIVVIILSVILIFLGLWAQASMYEAVKRVLGNGNLDFKDTFKTSKSYILKFLVVNFFVGVVVVLGMLLLVIPGLIFAVWYSFSVYIVISEGKGSLEAMRSSKALVKGRFWKVVTRLVVFSLIPFIGGMVVAFIPYNLGNLLLALFGGLFTLPYFIFYWELKGKTV
ncbi:MAG: hypothetical protein ACHQUA_01850 [Microgenomates group bacterium]